MTSQKTVVKVDHVGKFFRLPTEETRSLRTALVNRFRGIKGYREQHVLRDINFEVYEGDFFGIVGRNGSGKSTLLKIISQIYVPETGTVKVDGKLVSFIELGVGFNPELTGRENVYLNGAMLGFTTAQIDAMYDDIVDFAELRDFMNQKLKNYSSGMQVRLAFSVAIKAQGDILILDEVLAVGDEAFQRKCNDYFMERKQSGKTTILVTHDMSAVKKYCNRAVLVENGMVKAYGDPFDVANQYSVDNTELEVLTVEQSESEETGVVRNLSVDLLSGHVFSPQDPIVIEISYDVMDDLDTYIALSFTDIDRHVWIYNDNSMDLMQFGKGRRVVRYQCNLAHLNNVNLKLEVTIRDAQEQLLAYSSGDNIHILMMKRQDILPTDRSAIDSSYGLYQRNGEWTID